MYSTCKIIRKQKITWFLVFRVSEWTKKKSRNPEQTTHHH